MLRSSATSYYEVDGLGSVTSLSNVAGALAQTYRYDSFGKQTSSSGSLSSPFEYTARELDSETGLYFYRARFYDPSPGRFLSEDPTEFEGGVNFYSYVENSPLGSFDPWGLKLCKVNLPGLGPTYLDDAFYPRVKQWIDNNGADGMVTGANQEWALDFVHDAAESGRKFRVLSVIDVYTRECLALEVETSFATRRVTRELDRIVAERGVPEAIRCDNVLTTECYKGVRAKSSSASDFRRECSLNPSGFHRQQEWHSTIATQGPLKLYGLHCT
jgi:RHS repeat-associated protein